MEKRSEGQTEEKRSTSCLVEEEYTIAIPLVRPKAPFLQFLHKLGASCEVFTRKEILQYLRRYIVSKQMFDEQDPRVVHCKNDPLGDVFEVDQFTIDDVLDLLARHCIQLPDTKLKRQRRLVSKPVSSFSSSCTPSSSFTISVCRALSETSSPVISSTSNTLLSQKSELLVPPKPYRKTSSSSNCDTTDSTESSLKKATRKERKNSCLRNQISAAVQEEPPHSALTSQGKDMEEEAKIEKCVSSSEASSSTSEKRKSDSIQNSSSSRKRHKTEPGTFPVPGSSHCTKSQASSGDSSRRRSTSLNICYGIEDNKGDYPWYFQLSMDDDDSDGESEVLSIQGKETVIVQDSTDDLWFLEEESISVEVPSDTDFSVEYDIESDISLLTESDISSVRSGEEPGLLVVCKESDVEFFADCSDTESNDGDKELTPEDNWCCAECGYSNMPFQRYCSRCWKLRSDWLPTDSEGKTGGSQLKLKNMKEDVLATDKNEPAVERMMKDPTDSGIGSLSSTQPSSQETFISDIKDSVFVDTVPDEKLKHSACQFTECESLIEEAKTLETRYTYSNVQLKQKTSDSQVKQIASSVNSFSSKTATSKLCSSPDSESATKESTVTKSLPTEDPCMICLTRTKNASLIHGSSGHQVCCFACGKRLKRRGKLCPVCRRPIQKVVKNYIL